MTHHSEYIAHKQYVNPPRCQYFAILCVFSGFMAKLGVKFQFLANIKNKILETTNNFIKNHNKNYKQNKRNSI